MHHTPTARPLTLAQYAARWLQRLPARQRVSADTLLRYELYLRRHVLPLLGSMPLAGIRRRDIRALAELLEDSLAPGSIRCILGVLGALFTNAVRDELVETNPAAGEARAYRPGKGEPLLGADLALFLAALRGSRSPRADIFLLMLRTGLRIGEALGLQWTDLDLDAATVTVSRTWKDTRAEAPKTRRTRVVDLTDESVALLRARPRDAEWIFLGPRGIPWDRRTVQEDFARIAARAGLNGRYTSHSLRHTYATLLVAGGVDLRYVQEQLGHKSIAITSDLYARRARRPRPAALERLLDAPLERHPVRSLRRTACLRGRRVRGRHS